MASLKVLPWSRRGSHAIAHAGSTELTPGCLQKHMKLEGKSTGESWREVTEGRLVQSMLHVTYMYEILKLIFFIKAQPTILFTYKFWNFLRYFTILGFPRLKQQHAINKGREASLLLDSIVSKAGGTF